MNDEAAARSVARDSGTAAAPRERSLRLVVDDERACASCGRAFRRRSSEQICDACAGPLRRERQRVGLTQRELAELAGVSPSLIGQLERDGKTPSLELAEAIAQCLDVTVACLFGEPSPCKCGDCGELTLNDYREGHFRDAFATTNTERVRKFEVYKRETKLLDAGELAAAIGCHPHSLTEAARLGRMAPAFFDRYPGDWPESSRPLLFKPEDGPAIQALLRDGRAESCRRLMTDWWARRRASGDTSGTRPRTGVVKPCPGCGRKKYLRPSHAEAPGWHLRCWARHLRHDPLLRANQRIARWGMRSTGSATRALAEYAETMQRRLGGRPRRTSLNPRHARWLQMHQGEDSELEELATDGGCDRLRLIVLLDWQRHPEDWPRSDWPSDPHDQASLDQVYVEGARSRVKKALQRAGTKT
jgi:transcriptional regulator with XRE-family HTH domain